MTILDKIVAHKRAELDEAQRGESLEALRARADRQSSSRGFLTALRAAESRPALIAELKRASPSAGEIRGDLDPAALARIYASAGAHCLSVLTDQEFFRGSDADFAAARAAAQLPMLRKDFVLEPYHVVEARAIGADAVLLIAAILEQPALLALLALARELGMDALVEVHDLDEAARALDAGADLVGINNRDLGTFETTLATTERIAPLLIGKAAIVSESALAEPGDVRRVAEAGADAVLIGTAFCRSQDVQSEVRRVMGW